MRKYVIWGLMCLWPIILLWLFFTGSDHLSNGLVFFFNAPLTGLMLRLAWDRRKISDGRGIVLLVAVLVTGLWIGSAAMNLMGNELSLVVLFAFIILQPICGVVFAKYEVRETIE